MFQVKNQMLTACRSYITDNGTHLIWEQEADQVLRKMQVKMTLGLVNTFVIFEEALKKVDLCLSLFSLLIGLYQLVSAV